MDTAHVEALVMGGLTVFWLLLAGLALRLRIRTGVTNTWLYAGLVLAVITFALMVLNLNGVVFSGVGGSGTHRSAPAASTGPRG